MANEIIPGILEQEKEVIVERLSLIKSFTRTVHIDLLDGVFVDNTTFSDPLFFASYKDEFFFELHMMVDNPLAYIKPWANAGIKRFIGHIERMPDQKEFVTTAKEYGQVALALDAETPLEKLTVPLSDLDAILVMTIKAGFSGQQFLEEQLDKVRTLRQQTDIPIEVDGGISDQTIAKALSAGADRFVATSYLFGEGKNADSNYQQLESLA